MPEFSEKHANLFAVWSDRLLLLVLVLLPWQGRFIQSIGTLAGAQWEPGTRSVYAVEVILLTALVLYVLSKAHRRHSRPDPPDYLRLWGILLLYALVSAIWAARSEAAMIGWIHLFEGFALAYLLWVSRLPLRSMLYAFLIGSSLNALLAVFQFLTQTTFASTWLGLAEHPISQPGTSVIETTSGRFLRAYGLMPHPNVLGGYLAVGLFASLALFVNGGKKLKPFMLGALTLSLAGLIVSFSRSAWLGYAAAFLLAIVLIFKRLQVFEKARFKKALYLQIAVGLLALVLVAPLVMTRASVSTRLEKRSVSDRALSVSQAIELTQEHYIIGTGVNNMPVAAYQELEPKLEGYSYQPVHSVPLLILVELGFFGIMMFLGAAVAWIAAAKNLLARAERPVVAFTAVLPVCLVIIGLFDHYLFSQYAGVLLAGAVFGFFLKAETA